MKLSEILERIDEARSLWSYKKDPGIGIHNVGCYKLQITEHEKRGEARRRYLILFGDQPLTMSYDWDRFNKHLRKRDPQLEEEGSHMVKLSVQDEELREKIRLKCLNDWGLELDKDQISMCIYEMEEQKLSLFHGQIWPNKRRYKKDTGWGVRITWDKSIDGYRALAHRSGVFAGMDKAEFSGEGEGLIARVIVYRRGKTGERDRFVGEARFTEFAMLIDEYVNGQKTNKRVPNSQWSNSPCNQLGIAAERQALRKAFQECDDSVDSVIDTAPTVEPPEPPIEPSRGESTSDVEPKSEPKPEPKPEAKPEPESQPETKPKPEPEPSGKYVGVPQAGFIPYAMYNKEERIIRLKKSKGDAHLALDSGQVAVVNKEGYEIERRDWEGVRGGRDWVVGDTYYDGTKVEKVAASKKDAAAYWLALDNGFKVLVGEHGKEVKKKERKKKEAEKPKAQEEKPQEKEEEPKSDGGADIESLKTVEDVRKLSTPLLARWCREKNGGQKLSYKDAYKELTGVVITSGMTMTVDDHKVLYQCLEDVFEGAA